VAIYLLTMEATTIRGGREMAAYSQDLRNRALRAYQRGEPVTVIAERFEVNESWVHKVLQRFGATGGGRPAVWAAIASRYLSHGKEPS
jgi:hypothetical protein